jgi:hypothetical protein
LVLLKKEEKETLRLRWLILTCGIIFLSIAWLRKEVIDAVIALGLGLSSGFVLDWLGIKKLHLWDYPRQPFLGLKYFIIALPDWGVIGLTINLFWNWIETPWLAFVVVAVVLFLTHDFPNLITRSWHYNAPIWLVAIGWIFFILSFRTLCCFLKSIL